MQITDIKLNGEKIKTAATFVLQAAHVVRLEHLSDAVMCLESFVGTPMETDSTFKTYNGNVCFHQCYILYS